MLCSSMNHTGIMFHSMIRYFVIFHSKSMESPIELHHLQSIKWIKRRISSISKFDFRFFSKFSFLLPHLTLQSEIYLLSDYVFTSEKTKISNTLWLICSCQTVWNVSGEIILQPLYFILKIAFIELKQKIYNYAKFHIKVKIDQHFSIVTTLNYA